MKKFILIITGLVLILLAGCNFTTPTTSDEVSEEASQETLELIGISKEIPTEVTSGDTFEFTVSVNNTDTITHELRSIDISNTFLDGVLVTETNFPVKEEYNVIEQQIYEFQKDIPATTVTDITFTAKALEPGDYSGDLDICIDGDASCLFNSIRIIVK